MKLEKKLAKQRQRRTYRIRNAARRAAHGKPRLSVFRSNKHMYAQLIDDVAGHTLASASTAQGNVCGDGVSRSSKAGAAAVGAVIAALAKEQGISEVVFDRGPYKYHGRVAALADAARENGLQF